MSSGFKCRTSDAIIVDNSIFFDILPPNMVIMANRKFKQIDKFIY